MIQLVFVLAAAAGVAAWWQLMRGREKARVAAARVCAEQGLQLLDATVALEGIRGGRGWRPVARYAFEFSADGAERRRGTVDIDLAGRMTVTLDQAQGALLETRDAGSKSDLT